MLGETSKQLGTDSPMVTQAAWIRSLMASFVKEWSDDSDKIGGIFGAGRSSDELVLPWNRAMQVAVLIHAGRELKESVESSKSQWAKFLRSVDGQKLFDEEFDPAFYGKYSLLATDQGIRGWLQVTNDLCYVAADSLGLRDWTWEEVYSQRNARSLAATDEGAVDLAIISIKKSRLGRFLAAIASTLSSYDWRTSSTPGLSEDQRLKQAVFRGSSGYREIRLQLLNHLSKSSGDIGQFAKSVLTSVK